MVIEVACEHSLGIAKVKRRSTTFKFRITSRGCRSQPATSAQGNPIFDSRIDLTPSPKNYPTTRSLTGMSEDHRLLKLADFTADGPDLKHQLATGFQAKIDRVNEGAAQFCRQHYRQRRIASR